MKVLLVGSEVAPIIKLGGLGDVMGSLPKALQKLKLDVDVIVPYFPVADTSNVKLFKQLEIEVPFGGESIFVEVYKTKLPKSNVDVFLLRNARYFAMGGKSAFANSTSETEMFAFFNKAVVEFIKDRFNTYDLVHCNDWHTGLITHLLEEEIGNTRPATLITIHNLAYQGVAGLDLVQDVGFFPGDHPLIDWDTEDGDLNMMQQAITSCDYINTVSESYSKEILLKDMGGTLAEILQAREGRLVGILNGLDYSAFPRGFNSGNWNSAKSQAKESLRKELGLEVSDKPLFGFVSRLDPKQKGLDILYEVLPELIKNKAQVVILGVGDTSWEEKLSKLATKRNYKNDLSVNIKFDLELANRIFKASDFFLLPSRYEPCGLTQMISMHYGSLPVGHAVGGIKDTVKNDVNGFTFMLYSSKDLLKSIKDALKVYGTAKQEKMVLQALQEDFSWDKSAKKYKSLYEKVIEVREKALYLAEVSKS